MPKPQSSLSSEALAEELFDVTSVRHAEKDGIGDQKKEEDRDVTEHHHAIKTSFEPTNHFHQIVLSDLQQELVPDTPDRFEPTGFFGVRLQFFT